MASWLFCWASLSNANADTGYNGFDCSTNPTVSSCGWELPDGGTSLTISDDGYAQVNLPFQFPFYGDYYGTSFMHSNGVVSFPYNNAVNPTHHFCCSGYDLETAINNGTYASSYPQFHHFVAVLWTDLINLNKDIDGDGINDNGFYTWVEDADDGSQYQHYLWRNISEFYNANNNNTVGLSLKDNGGITINHGEVNITNHSVNVGIYGDPSLNQYDQIYYGYGKNSGWSDTQQQYTGIPSYDITALCNANPLFNASCPGYADAYAEWLYDQACAADPLYDSGCDGYATAYYNQQCSLDPLYDSGCSGYAEAYFDQQCTLSQLYDTECPGYEQAYYDTYIAPELERQANEAAGVEDSTTTTTVDTGIDNDELLVSDPVEAITNTEITGDAFVDQILRDGTDTDLVEIDVPDASFDIPEAVDEPEVEVVVEDTIDEPVENIETMVESVEEDTTEDTIEVAENTEETTDEPQESVEETENEPQKSVAKKDNKKKSKKEKVKELMMAKANALADDMSKAATAEQQAIIQQQVMAVMAYVYGFDQYKVTMNGGYYPDTNFYNITSLPNSQRGLRNGLAQQILWDKMVDMQYEKMK